MTYSIFYVVIYEYSIEILAALTDLIFEISNLHLFTIQYSFLQKYLIISAF